MQTNTGLKLCTTQILSLSLNKFKIGLGKIIVLSLKMIIDLRCN